MREVEYIGDSSPYTEGTSIPADATIKTWDLVNFGEFTVRYELTDKSLNSVGFDRNITVVDTTPPTLELVKSSTVSRLPSGFATADALPKKVYSEDDWKTFQVVGDDGVEIDFTGTGEVIEIATGLVDSKGRAQRRVGGFKVLDGLGQTLYTDPGVYVTDNAQGEFTVTVTNAPLTLSDEAVSYTHLTLPTNSLV